ncbi:hypothetical protein NDI56_16270 [Haloarcula sp. S1CR25-12]|uniref:Secreted protein n=1 Tax=Haloarcula saliterrae TaxID=2950534 RepID=A0ABU2FG80_9EURY|nr:hypothetical protein [Haloarcula sp. S1CR25-12]MDS0260958.1 hypothetical protein [Haloarcula sp. S1CR25-12]
MRAITLLVVCTVLVAGCSGFGGTDPATPDTDDPLTEPSTEGSETPEQSETAETYSGGETPPGPPAPPDSSGRVDASAEEYEWSDSTPQFIAANQSAQEYCTSDSVSPENYDEYCTTV